MDHIVDETRIPLGEFLADPAKHLAAVEKGTGGCLLLTRAGRVCLVLQDAAGHCDLIEHAMRGRFTCIESEDLLETAHDAMRGRPPGNGTPALLAVSSASDLLHVRNIAQDRYRQALIERLDQ